jgi:hypothetical protein
MRLVGMIVLGHSVVGVTVSDGLASLGWTSGFSEGSAAPSPR